MAIDRHITTGLPGETLNEIHDCLTLALDASERPCGYSQAERESRSYVRSALRRVNMMMERSDA